MKKILLSLVAMLVMVSCEKELPTPNIDDPNLAGTIDFRANESILELIDCVMMLKDGGEIPQGPAQSILAKLASIQMKLDQNKPEVAQEKLEELVDHLETLVSEGELDGEIASMLIVKIEFLHCEIDPDCCEDSAPPIAVCDEDLQISLGGNGIARLTVQDLDAGSSDFDNCTITWNNDISYSFFESGIVTSINLNCSDRGEVSLQLWITDAAGNQSSCDVIVEVKDRYGVCPP